jgi:hypothetical protein
MRFAAHTRDPMSENTTMAPSVFALRTSVFNDFLYAPVGEEENGMILTALSALARLGVDPWDEAARLSELPQETATKRLTSIISGLPHGKWAASAAGEIAARLAALLPGKQPAAAQSQATVQPNHRPSPAVVMMFLGIFLANALAFTVLRNREAPSPIDQNAPVGSTVAPPRAPLP